MKRTYTYRIQMKAPWIPKFVKYLDGLGPGGPIIAQVLRRVLLLGILRKIRERYLENMQRALVVSIAKREDASIERLQEAVATALDMGRLKAAAAALDKAVLAGKPKQIARAQEHFHRTEQDIQEKANDVLTRSSLNKKRNRVHAAMEDLMGTSRIGVITGALMRRRMGTLLEYMTGAMYLSEVQRVGASSVIGGGRRSLIDLIETPSATYMLDGTRSPSNKKTLWRHLEYGTGRWKKPGAGDEGPGKYSRADGSWVYGASGPDGEGGFVVGGTKPMSFLWTDANLVHPDYYLAGLEELKQAMVDLAFTGTSHGNE